MGQVLYSITKQRFNELLTNISRDFRVVSPQGDENYLFETHKDSFTFSKYRAVTSLRQFFVPSQENIGSYFNDTSVQKKPFCIVGVKNCDLQSLKIQDYVFLEDDADPHYAYMRENNIIISTDCTGFKEVCFCLNLEINPYPSTLFDLNLSFGQDSYLVEVASGKGEKIIKDNEALFEKVTQAQIKKRDDDRSALVSSLKEHLRAQDLVPKQGLYQLIKDSIEADVWPSEALRCVECGACIMNCPTCHCFLLFDTKKNDQFLKGRIWDGCQYKNFSRVAGGANPLTMRAKRLRNRYIKKFEFFPDVIGEYACTGCGRCIECCLAKIDLREIFKMLQKQGKGTKQGK